MTGSLPFARVLVAIDGSEGGQRALDLGALFAAASGAVLHVMTVEDLPPLLMDGISTQGTIEALQDALGAITDECHKAAADAATKVGVRMEFHAIRMGPSPGPAICELAESLPADLVLVGCRGHGPIRSAVLGSVSTYIVHHCKSRILVDRLPVARPHDEPLDKGPAPVREITAAVTDRP